MCCSTKNPQNRAHRSNVTSSGENQTTTLRTRIHMRLKRLLTKFSSTAVAQPDAMCHKCCASMLLPQSLFFPRARAMLAVHVLEWLNPRPHRQLCSLSMMQQLGKCFLRAPLGDVWSAASCAASCAGHSSGALWVGEAVAEESSHPFQAPLQPCFHRVLPLGVTGRAAVAHGRQRKAGVCKHKATSHLGCPREKRKRQEPDRRESGQKSVDLPRSQARLPSRGSSLFEGFSFPFFFLGVFLLQLLPSVLLGCAGPFLLHVIHSQRWM